VTLDPTALDPTALDHAARAYAAGEGWHYRPTDATGPEHLKRAAAVIETYLGTAGPLAEVEWHLELFVSGKAAPQGSKHARPIYRGKGKARVFTGKVVNVESSKSGVDTWRADVRAASVIAWDGRPPLDGPLVLEVEFIRKRPASAPKSYTPDANTQPDLSKLIRSTEDALTSAGVWADDGRVVHTVSSKRCAEHGETPGAHIRIGRLPSAREKWEAEREAARSVRSGSPRASAQKKKPSDRFSGPQPVSPVSSTATATTASDAQNEQGARADSGAPPPCLPLDLGQNRADVPDLLAALQRSITARTTP
jgi:Holliday junction resolvase RusA-like endonuclease